MDFSYSANQLCMDGVNLTDIARQYATPAYVYSAQTIRENFAKFNQAIIAHQLNSTLCYAVKANSNLSILKLFDQLGAGFDIVSIGELQRLIAANCATDKVVFSGVGKTHAELEFAIAQNIKCINVESFAELERLQAISAKLKVKTNIAVRLNPNIDAKTHPYISTGLKENKFGIDIDFLDLLLDKLKKSPNLTLIGLAFHLGSQISDISPFVEALEKFESTWDYFVERGFNLKHLDLGGGYAICYKDEKVFDFATLLTKFSPSLKAKVSEFIFAPGRALIGNAGVLLARVEYLKKTSAKNFAILDTSMNDIIRPALYHAWHDVAELVKRDKVPTATYDLVGSICETGDFIAKARNLSIEQGDYLAIKDAGAYGFSMASNYNSRLMPIEILVDKDKIKVIRQRQTYSDLYKLELND